MHPMAKKYLGGIWKIKKHTSFLRFYQLSFISIWIGYYRAIAFSISLYCPKNTPNIYSLYIYVHTLLSNFCGIPKKDKNEKAKYNPNILYFMLYSTFNLYPFIYLFSIFSFGIWDIKNCILCLFNILGFCWFLSFTWTFFKYFD